MARVGDPERDGGRADCDGRVTTLALPVLLYTPHLASAFVIAMFPVIGPSTRRVALPQKRRRRPSRACRTGSFGGAPRASSAFPSFCCIRAPPALVHRSYTRPGPPRTLCCRRTPARAAVQPPASSAPASSHRPTSQIDQTPRRPLLLAKSTPPYVNVQTAARATCAGRAGGWIPRRATDRESTERWRARRRPQVVPSARSVSGSAYRSRPRSTLSKNLLPGTARADTLPPCVCSPHAIHDPRTPSRYPIMAPYQSPPYLLPLSTTTEIYPPTLAALQEVEAQFEIGRAHV